jgi:hypothetical protein
MNDDEIKALLQRHGFLNCISPYYVMGQLSDFRNLIDEVTALNKPDSGRVGDEVVDRVAKAIADAAGHGMREKCEHLARAALAAQGQGDGFDFASHLQRQRDWSGKTFGPGSRAQGVVDHIRKELLEIEVDPGDLKEWIDVVILALDGAWRSGAQPQEIIAALVAKQTKNEGRVWPDWRTADPNKAIEHDRSRDTAASPAGVLDVAYRADYTLQGLIQYGKTAANPAQGAKDWHMRDLIGQMVPCLIELAELKGIRSLFDPAAPSAPEGDGGADHG